ncbi:hypothetical protein CR161_03070 [Prosthecochloris sp. ZM]|uniref:pirin family protein n=1 Tax=Prosthecochloris sp. ZM TaxID=2283143 RepID=UPI000DF85FC2|nr:pirin family protein [Prosthecochloris sp. ZM]RDD29766.1 hypothetical protein CR161_03070 [Prosthecochloris sp. ZM]
MHQPRTIRKVFKSKPVTEGAGVKLKRAFGFSESPLFDPFLLLDDFRSDNPDDYLAGFPRHPHRGIETITYLLEGHVEHRDSLGNSGRINAGDVQWMTAGSGIIHEEMPVGSSRGGIAGFQVWANLPASQKMTPPRYRDISAEMIPEVHLDNQISLRVIAGEIEGIKGPADDIAIDPVFLDIIIPPETAADFPVNPAHSAAAYIIGGSATFSHDMQDMNASASPGNETVLLFNTDGDHLHIVTHEESVRFLFLSAKPLNEPVAWHGPIVMNTNHELQKAFEDYENGTFIKE